MSSFIPYGNFWAGDVLYNLRVGIYGIEVSFRFIAKDTVPVNKIRYFNTYSKTKPGYHAGTGGKIKIELQEDDNTSGHNPSGKVLTTGLVPDPLNSPDQLLVKFFKTAILEKDKIYHIVFTNYDANPDINYVSVDMMSVMTPKPVTVPDQPELSIIDMTTLWRDRINKNWRRFKDNLSVTPIFSLFYEVTELSTDNISVIGYGGMESWLREPRQICGDKRVRQRFIPRKDIAVKNVSVRIAKVGNPGNLTAQLELLNNKVIDKSSISSNLVKPIDLSICPPYRLGHDWVVLNFSSSILLESGKEYCLVLKAPSGDSWYEMFPLRDGESFGYAPVWPNSYAEYTTTTGENGWRGWDAWGISNLKIGDLQLYFNSSK